MIKPIGIYSGIGIGNDQALSLDSGKDIIDKLNEVIDYINEAERDKEENTKNAYWIFEDNNEFMRCSNCEGNFIRGLEKYYNYCPKCGALIVGVKNG